MIPKETQKKIQEIADKIAKKYQPEKIILFGSYAWGRPHKWSDVDLFIVKQSNKKRWEREHELRRKIFPPEMSIDLLIYTPREIKERVALGDFFVKDVINKGKILYG